MSGYYTEYLNRNFNFQSLDTERKKELKNISTLRGDRDILVYASDLNKGNAPIQIDYTDILPFNDQLKLLKGNSIDIILETPGGFAEVVEDIVGLVRGRYEKVGVIIPGYAKSAGTIFAMAGDEILMGSTSALGPIDGQISFNGKKFSADAFLEGLNKIKTEIEESGKLNAAYIPILQNISPGEIQHCENVQAFSKTLVTKWLAEYKFKYWDKHKSTLVEVTPEDKNKRAEEIATNLCTHSNWLTHGRSIKIDDFKSMKLQIINYEDTPKLEEAIMRYYTLLRMSFDTNMYKLYETKNSQIYRFLNASSGPLVPGKGSDSLIINYQCPNCKNDFEIQANFKNGVGLKKNAVPFPTKNNNVICPKCRAGNNLGSLKLEIEGKYNKKIL